MAQIDIKIEEILQLIPHRYPFLLIDGVNKLDNKFISAFKNVTANEIFFQGHFPNSYIFPGVLIIEAIAQAACVLVLKNRGPLKLHELFRLARIRNVRFTKTVLPGDQMVIEVYFQTICNKIVEFDSMVTVGKKIVCKASMTCIIK